MSLNTEVFIISFLITMSTIPLCGTLLGMVIGFSVSMSYAYFRLHRDFKYEKNMRTAAAYALTFIQK